MLTSPHEKEKPAKKVLTAEKIFQNNLDAIALLFSMEIPGKTVSERFEELIAIAKRDPQLAQSIHSLSGAIITQVTTESRRMNENYNFFHLVCKMLAACAIQAAVFSYSRVKSHAPRKQHWLPFVYLKRFGNQAGKRTLNVSGVVRLNDMLMAYTVRDGAFIHKLETDGTGFYKDNAERFFAIVEGIYGNFLSNNESAEKSRTILAPAAFFVTQSVRNPNPDHRNFGHKSLGEIIERIVENLDLMDGSFYAKVKRKNRMVLPFTPYTPARVRNIANGGKIFVLPLSMTRGLIIGTRPIPKENNYLQKYRDSMVVHADRNGVPLFGITKKQYLTILKRAKK